MASASTSTSGRSPGCFRGYTSEQKTVRAKLDLMIKWGRDLKTNVMKQSCKVLQTNNPNTRETIDQIHDDLDDYKRKIDRELGLIHDICDALTISNQSTNGDEENLQDEILEALRRSPTYTSLEQHIHDDKRPRIRVKPHIDCSNILTSTKQYGDEETPPPPPRTTNSAKKVAWTSSEIQITGGNSQSQSMRNPYRIGITDPSIRSIFLPPPSSQTTFSSTGANKRSQNSNRKRTTGPK
ncbi:unnamed protein product [Adineta ricciae]|uniref:Uncharacterized protein n=1 Tax=Adineta ricciae TaxID=249248 RepID=A0A813NDG4_ADIRI|nr:unnamed protein product [Adineta ricciae]